MTWTIPQGRHPLLITRPCGGLLESSAPLTMVKTAWFISVLTFMPSSFVMSTRGPGRGLSTLMCVLMDGEIVVAAVEVVAIEVDDSVVDPDVVELFETADCVDLAEDTDIFFLALLDCV